MSALAGRHLDGPSLVEVTDAAGELVAIIDPLRRRRRDLATGRLEPVGEAADPKEGTLGRVPRRRLRGRAARGRRRTRGTARAALLPRRGAGAPG